MRGRTIVLLLAALTLFIFSLDIVSAETFTATGSSTVTYVYDITYYITITYTNSLDATSFDVFTYTLVINTTISNFTSVYTVNYTSTYTKYFTYSYDIIYEIVGNSADVIINADIDTLYTVQLVSSTSYTVSRTNFAIYPVLTLTNAGEDTIFINNITVTNAISNVYTLDVSNSYSIITQSANSVVVNNTSTSVAYYDRYTLYVSVTTAVVYNTIIATYSLSDVKIYNDFSTYFVQTVIAYNAIPATIIVYASDAVAAVYSALNAQTFSITVPARNVAYKIIYYDSVTSVTAMFPTAPLLLYRMKTYELFQNNIIFVYSTSDDVSETFQVTLSLLHTSETHTVTFILDASTVAIYTFVNSGGYSIFNFTVPISAYTGFTVLDVINSTYLSNSTTFTQYTMTIVKKLFVPPKLSFTPREDAIDYSKLGGLGAVILSIIFVSLFSLTKIKEVSVALAINSIIVAAFTLLGVIPSTYGYVTAGVFMLLAFTARIFENN